MKYNEFIKQIYESNDNQYERISVEELSKKIRSAESEKFTSKEIKLISDIVPQFIVETDPYAQMSQNKLNRIKIENKYIFKGTDEWYVILDEKDNLYLCDQIQGLLNCLKDIFNIPIKENKIDDNEYYYKINVEKCDHIHNNYTKEYFIKNEIEKIRSILPKEYKVGNIVDYSHLYIMGNKEFIEIDKYSDERYILSYNSLHYYCDGFKGVLEYLKDHIHEPNI